MSHYTLMVALPGSTPLEELNNVLEERLKPFDETKRVDPYRSYETDSAEAFWWTSAVRRAAAEIAEDAPLHIQSGFDGKYWSHSRGNYMTRAEAEQDAREQRQRLADEATKFSDPATWPEVVDAYNRHYGHGPGEGESVEAWRAKAGQDPEVLFYDEESDRAYTMTTYNPNSKWDWWSIGGRWTGYFIPKKSAKVDLVTGTPGVFGHVAEGGKVDGGRKRDLDFEAMRDEAEAKIRAEYERWVFVTAEHPEPKPWTHFVGLVEAGVIDMDEARSQFRKQPALLAAIEDDKPRGGSGFGWEWDLSEVVERFQFGVEPAVKTARDAAVPGYAFLDLDGEWVAPGRMGWFGMSTDDEGERDGYRHAVSTYLDEKVDDEDFLVILDLHI